MRKTYSVLLSCFLFFSASAQHADTTSLNKRLYLGGSELLKFKKTYTIGLAIEIVGASMAVGGAVSDATVNKGLIDAGIGVGVIGLITIAASYAHIGRAGLYFRGNAIGYRF